MDRLNDQLTGMAADYYNTAIVDQENVVLPYYVFDVEVLRQHFMTDYNIPGRCSVT